MNSLKVQWLRFHASNAVGTGLIPGLGIMGFQVSPSIKNLPAVQETRVQSLGVEDPLKKEMATDSSPWKIPWTEEPDDLQSVGLQESDMISN